MSRLAVHACPFLNAEHGADLLWNNDLAFHTDDRGFHVSNPSSARYLNERSGLSIPATEVALRAGLRLVV